MADGLAARDFVFLYAPPWSGPTRFSKHHLAEHLAATGNRVLFCEAPLTPLGLRRGRQFAGDLARTLRAPTQVGPNLWVRRHFLPIPFHAAIPFARGRWANRVGQCLLAPTVRRDLARLGFRRPIVVAGLPHVADILPHLPRSRVIYHCADDYASVSGFPSAVRALEEQLCRRADLVITTSLTLCEERRRFNSTTRWVANGADVSHFAQAARPAAEMTDMPHPIVGFIGGLSEWVDVALIARLAGARPMMTFVLVGPVGIDARALDGLSNVRLLGPRPYSSLPSYLAAMDVALIPFKHDRVTYHADPIKAYEYLASGVPVVATDLPALRRLAPVMHVATSPDEFARAIDAALAESSDPRRRFARRAEAQKHSWANRFAEIDALIEDTFPCAS
ncbi:MAG: hypothetical protein NVSMB2_26270 [Chloroflexota bacterium]